MMISNGMMRSAMQEVPTIESTSVKTKDEDTTQTQTCENKVEIHKDGSGLEYQENDIHTLSHLMLSLASMVTPILGVQEAKDLQHCYHELDKRLAVVEALVEHMTTK